jgi:DNA-binding PadR family transcriptional regulator
MSSRKLSTIELTVLGITWLRGPCTTYVVMKELSVSASTFYKSRAGTAYSVVKRMLDFGLLHQDAGKEESLLRITEAGIQALQAWITPPVPMTDVAHSADLVRLRFFFLGIVDLETRLAFIDNSIASLQEFKGRCESLIQANQDLNEYFGALATLSTVLETQARIDWLRKVRELVIVPLDENEDWSARLLKAIQANP